MPSLLLDPALFAHAQRAAALFASSELFPKHLRSGIEKSQHVANAVMVLNIAQRMREDPLMVAQNIYFVGGKPGWSTSYMIARANASQIFRGRITWATTGDGDKMSVTARAVLADTGETVSATVDYAMAKAEGWVANKKYTTMREHMLRFRSATMLIRLYCPEVMLGIQSTDELEDIRASEARDVTPLKQAAAQMSSPIVAPTDAAIMTPPANVQTAVDAEMVETIDEDTGDVVDADAPSDAALALQIALEDLAAVTVKADLEPLNARVKSELAGTTEIGAWNTAYIEAQAKFRTHK